MTLLAFVLMLTLPVAMFAKKSPGTVILVALWGFTLSLTPIGPAVADFLGGLGSSALGAFT